MSSLVLFPFSLVTGCFYECEDCVTRSELDSIVGGGDYYTRDEVDAILVGYYSADEVDTIVADAVESALATVEGEYQPVGEYLTPDDIDEYCVTDAELESALSAYQPAGDYLTQAEGEGLYQPLGSYLSKTEADGYYQPLGSYLSKTEADGYYQPLGSYLSKTEADGYYQAAGSYLTKTEADEYYQTVGAYLTKTEADGYYQTVGAYLTKTEADGYYQTVGDYALAGDLDGFATEVWVEAQGYLTSGALDAYATIDDATAAMTLADNLAGHLTLGVDDFGYDAIMFDGVNVYIRNGLDTDGDGVPDGTISTNGLGNFVVGYGEGLEDGVARTGSHNIVAGVGNGYEGAAALIIGGSNNVGPHGAYGVVFGGHNIVDAPYGAVLGGELNTIDLAAAEAGVIAGGFSNTVSGPFAVSVGGFENTVAGEYAAVLGGTSNLVDDLLETNVLGFARVSNTGGADPSHFVDYDIPYVSMVGAFESSGRTFLVHVRTWGDETNGALGTYLVTLVGSTGLSVETLSWDFTGSEAVSLVGITRTGVDSLRISGNYYVVADLALFPDS